MYDRKPMTLDIQQMLYDNGFKSNRVEIKQRDYLKIECMTHLGNTILPIEDLAKILGDQFKILDVEIKHTEDSQPDKIVINCADPDAGRYMK